jgi:hypothetical protein
MRLSAALACVSLCCACRSERDCVAPTADSASMQSAVATEPAPASTAGASRTPAGALVVGFEDPSALARWLGDAANEPEPPGGAQPEWFAAQDTVGDRDRFVFRRAWNPPGRESEYRLCWGNGTRLKNGWVSVRVRAEAGERDQGGGIAWRVRDRSNYYLARYNPLERNLRCYTVRGGVRTQLASAEGIAIPVGQWFKLDVRVDGEKFTIALDGAKRLEVHNSLFSDLGGVGLWVKDDSVCSFDDLVIRADE